MPDDPQADPFAPPELSTEVCCLHCGETYDSWQIEWRTFPSSNGQEQGFWCCPVPGCDGKGFGFDIHPTDPDYQDENGAWFSFDEDDEEDLEGEWDGSEEEQWDELSAAATEESSGGEIPWGDPAPNPPRSDPPEQRDDWPFSMN